MFIVIFRAKIKSDDPVMTDMGEQLRQLAIKEFGCLDFVGMTEGDEEMSVSYWPDESSIQRWKEHAEHIAAQTLGREKWYTWYSVEVAEVTRRYQIGSKG